MSAAPGTVVYALGGGRGHLTRALLLAERLPGPVTVLHQVPEPPRHGRVRTLPLGTPRVHELHEVLDRELAGAHTLVVDTFPAGVAHEASDAFHRPGLRTVLVARHLDRAAYPDYDAHAARFHEVWLPYDPDACEWDDPPPATAWLGPLTRPLSLQGSVDTLLIGAGEPPSWTPLLRGATRIDGPFHTLPRARRTIALSAGYNLSWELRSLGIHPALRPLPRRFDDQFARAARLGHPLHHQRDLVRFLEAPCS